MKKYLSIMVTVLFLSGIFHLTVAIHYCGGEISETLISVNGKKASCGMHHEMDLSSETNVSSRCCDDETVIYSVDKDYAPSSLNSTRAVLSLLIQLSTGLSSVQNIPFITSVNYTDSGPPEFSWPNSVSIARICTYRI
ncbi:MAG TPA: hypothetical protein VHI78_04995 [Bacteroidales bacterium]|jgi:hypothetical protein|nr:hypothetical protein [Bacteroidales bacterium]